MSSSRLSDKPDKPYKLHFDKRNQIDKIDNPDQPDEPDKPKKLDKTDRNVNMDFGIVLHLKFEIKIFCTRLSNCLFVVGIKKSSF